MRNVGDHEAPSMAWVEEIRARLRAQAERMRWRQPSEPIICREDAADLARWFAR